MCGFQILLFDGFVVLHVCMGLAVELFPLSFCPVMVGRRGLRMG